MVDVHDLLGIPRGTAPASEPHDSHRCRVCGCRFGEHRGSDRACPPGRGWGDAEPFPHPSRDAGSTNAAKSARALAAWDRRIARHWARSRGRFAPA
jgi:hypothetical protein